MSDQYEELHLPNTTIVKLIKQSTSGKLILTKDAKNTLNQMAAVFILYITNAANQNARQHKRKTINDGDIILAIQETQFDFLTPILKKNLEDFEKQQNEKKKHGAKGVLDKSTDGEVID